MFPSHDAVVTAVPEYERNPLLDELETSTDAFAAAHPGVEVWPAGASRAFSLADDYDYYEKYGADPAVLLTSGTSSDACAEAKLRGLDVQQQLATWLRERYVLAAPHLARETPWQRTVHAYLTAVKDDLRAARKQAEAEADFAKEATVAQLVDALCLRDLDTLSRVGQFANMLAAEPEQNDALVTLRAEAEAKVRDRAPQLASAGGLEPVPIRALVQCQLAALLCTLVAVRERYRPAHPRPSMARIAL